MPKIITADRELIISITKNLIEEKRYDEINCRSIAKIANIGVGTIYHFFKTKMDIIATIIFDDWVKTMNSINLESSLEEGIKSIYVNIYNFSCRYYDFWHNTKDVSSGYITNVDKHSLLIKQINDLLVRLFNFNHYNCQDEDLLNFISECIIYHASRLDEFDHVGKFINKLIGGQ